MTDASAETQGLDPRSTRKPEKPALRLSPPDPGLQALRELCDATESQSVPPIAVKRRANFAWFFIRASAAGSLAGAVVFAFLRAEHDCAAIFRIREDAPVARRMEFRRELLDTAWEQSLRQAAASASDREIRMSTRHWTLETPGPDRLQIVLRTREPEIAVSEAREIASRFLSRLRARAEAERDTPGDGESILREYLDDLTARLTESRGQVDRVMAALPSADPSRERQALHSHWESLRNEFDETRRELVAASATLERLQADPEPQAGVVDSEERSRAIAGDASLVADLKELNVRLTELKQHLLAAVGGGAGPLDALVESANRLEHILGQTGLQNSELVERVRSDLQSNLDRYVGLLNGFADAWRREGGTLQGASTDAHSGVILDIGSRLRGQLNDFLFATSSTLANARTGLNKLGELIGDQAKYHVWHSDLVRGFQIFQRAHHRFEFAASRVEGKDNFRLDAAWHSTLGLRRRTQERLGQIEKQLHATALDRARKQRQLDMQNAASIVERIRGATDQTVSELVRLQDTLNQSAALSEEFHKIELQVAAATHRLQATQEHLRFVDDRMDQLAQARRKHSIEPGIDLISCGVLRQGVNLPDRLQTSAIGATLAFAAAGLTQLWLRRSD